MKAKTISVNISPSPTSAESPRVRSGVPRSVARPRSALPLLLRLALLPLAWPGSAATDAGGEDFIGLTLEELAQIQITSIARKQGSLFDTSAAAYVLTGDDLHRTGATDLASALRSVPGMQVGQIDPFNYAISTRGFNDATSSKLLVLMDGRSLYSQTFSGAYWNYHELFLEDVDRLETIRGPGATLWGANAVNGVINIVTKSAFSTRGSLLTVATGDRLDALVAARHGWKWNPNLAARVYVRYHEDADYGDIGQVGINGWRTQLAGTRLDWKRPGGGGLTVIGEWRDQRVTSLTPLPLLVPPFLEISRENRDRRGGHILGRWRQPVAGGEITIQSSYERMTAEDLSYGEKHHIFDSDVQLSLRPFSGHDLLAGVSVRQDRDQLRSSRVIRYTSAAASTTFLGAFIQDEITLVPNRLSVTVGSKIERNTFTGWELQPGIRALWRPTPDQRIWGAVSRAARTPSRAERTITWLAAVIPPSEFVPIPAEVIAKGSPDFDSEHLTAIELGHRLKVSPRLSFDTALYVNQYRDVRGLQSNVTPFIPVPVPRANFTLTATNNVRGTTYGGEFLTRWRCTPALNLEASVSSLRYDLRDERPSPTAQAAIPGLVGSTIAGLVGSAPRQDYKLRANWDCREDWTFDVLLRRSDALGQHGIPPVTGLDVHLGWRPRHDLEIEVVSRNSLDARHAEIPPTFLGGTLREIPRSYFLRVTYRR